MMQTATTEAPHGQQPPVPPGKGWRCTKRWSSVRKATTDANHTHVRIENALWTRKAVQSA